MGWIDLQLFSDRVDVEQGWQKLLMHMTCLLGAYVGAYIDVLYEALIMTSNLYPVTSPISLISHRH